MKSVIIRDNEGRKLIHVRRYKKGIEVLTDHSVGELNILVINDDNSRTRFNTKPIGFAKGEQGNV